MKISEIAIKRPITTTMLVLLVVLLGFIAFSRLNIDLFPKMTYPAVAIITSYEGVGPEEIENMVTKPLEATISTVTNIKGISSTSATGQSIILAEFNWGTDMDMTTMDLRERIDMVEGFFPDEVDNPLIIKFDPSLMPVMQLGVSSQMDLATLKKFIEDKISPRLERLEGVASVNLVGGKEREVLISLDQTKLQNYQVGFSTVVNTLMMENLNLSGGTVARGNNELLVRVTGKFSSIDEIKEILIPIPGGMVPLEDIGQVKSTYKELNTLSRMNNRPSIGITIQKQTDANTVMVSRLVRKELAKIIKESGQELQIIPIMDQAEFIEGAIGNVGQNAIIGALLAVLVLFLFLRNLRSTMIIATAIPVSIITTFLLIYFGDLTINMMTLGGLALGVGMLVDNSIVVLENIYRYRSEGCGRIEAAREGSQEVSMAIIASTITTAIVFLPVIFVGGITAQIFKELALTVTFSLLASLIVSLTLIPTMCSKILKIKEEKMKKGENGLLKKIKDGYRNGLAWCLSHRWLVLIVTIVVFIGSISLFPHIGSEFIPEMDQGQFSITANMPLGTSLAETDQAAAVIEEKVLNIPEVKSLLANIGSSGLMVDGSSSETSSFQVRLVDHKERDHSTVQIMEELRNSLKIPDAEIAINSQDMLGSFGGKAVTITVKGDDLEQLEELTNDIRVELASIEGIREIDDTLSEGRPELQVKVDRDLAAKMGLRVSQIGSAVKTAISGTTATRYEIGGKEYDIRVKLAEEDISTPIQVEDLLIPTATGARVPLKTIADFSVKQGPKQILRDNQVRYVNITADLYNRDLGSVMTEIQTRLAEKIQLPAGYQLEYGGQFKEMQSAFQDLFYAFLLAIVLVYMVMASQFESLLHPFVIMFTVPMAIIGVMLGLFTTGYKFSVVSIIGVIMLAGIVVNNGIVFIDYINTLRKKGRTIREAVLEAGPVRLRPILMTALTTILGLLPLALGIGEGAEVEAPMAVVVIGGLTISTILTLFVLPVLYSLFTKERHLKEEYTKGVKINNPLS